MPALPRWHADLEKIRAALDHLPAPFLDRPAVERLFGLRARGANYLMRKLGGGYRIGPAVVIDRAVLAARLELLAGTKGFGLESRRQARVVEALDGLRSQARPRRVAPPPPPEANSPLPAGARLSAPGELTICFRSPEQLLGAILGLAQSAAGDFAAFAAGLEFAPNPEAETEVAAGQAGEPPAGREEA